MNGIFNKISELNQLFDRSTSSRLRANGFNQRFLKQLTENPTAEFGNGFDVRNLRNLLHCKPMQTVLA
ncbi:MAG: hypothetical protein PHU06_12705 [Gallionella sp.]|nr:hypothetical protein [Gallionella sp.]MDD4959514.1 hypothetical protein [Gallionella sp.]